MATRKKLTGGRPTSAHVVPWGSIGDNTVNLTGSNHLFVVKYENGTEFKILLDCGIYQGRNSDQANHADFPFKASDIDLAILTHGHADHCGRFPSLVKAGYEGKIWSSPLTAAIAKFSLEDSAKLMKEQFDTAKGLVRAKMAKAGAAVKTIAESKKSGIPKGRKGRVRTSDFTKVSPQEVEEAEQYLKRYGIRNSSEIQKVFVPKMPDEPLFVMEDVDKTCSQFEGHNTNAWIRVPGAMGVSIQFFDACHVLGSTSVAIRVRGLGTGRAKSKTFVFSGDLGPTREFQPHGTGTPRIPDDVHPDLIFVESTYGGRRHYDGREGRPTCWADVVSRLEQTVQDASRKRDILIIPAFALDRAQLVLHLLVNLKKKGAFKGNIYLDSPLSTKYARLYQRHLPAYSKTLRPSPDTYSILEKPGRKEALSKPGFKIVVTSSGMGNGGPITDYFLEYLRKSRAEFTFTGYMAEETMGRALTDGIRTLWLITNGKKDSKEDRKDLKLVLPRKNWNGRPEELPENVEIYEVEAKVDRIDGLSSHADEDMVRKWCGVESPAGSGKPKLRFPNVRVSFVHGERDTSIVSMKHAFKRRLFPESQIVTASVGVPVEL